jgi:HSP20 family protein
MIVRYWQPLQEVDTLRRQLDRMFDDWVGADPVVDTTWTPAISLTAEGDDYVLQVQLPGVEAETIDLQASRKSIAISGERKAPDYTDNQHLLHNEVRYGTFWRVVTLPTAIEHDQVQADYAQGMLTVRLPKAVEARNQVVKVSIQGAQPPAIASTETEADA